MARRPQWLFIVACSGVLLAPLGSFAQRADNDTIAREAVAQLASESWQARIRASETILELAETLDESAALPTLERALETWIADARGSDAYDGDLAEVLARFEFAAINAFFKGPRAGLGITYDQSPSSTGVRLGGTVQGFDAYEKLRDGDIVLSISGIPVESGSLDLPVAIASHLPGEEALIELIRGGETMEVAVTLGRRADLNAARRLNQPVVRRAWALRLARLRGEPDQSRLETDAVRVVIDAPDFESTSRSRPRLADVAIGGTPGMAPPRLAGVVAQAAPGNNNQAAIRAELSRVNSDLGRVLRAIRAIEASIASADLELRMTADTVEGRAYAEQLRARVIELRTELGPLQQEQVSLMRDRVRLMQALSQ